MTIGAASLALATENLKSDRSFHAIAGYITFGLVILMSLLGLLAEITRRSCNYDWETYKLIRLKNMHKYMAYFIIAGSQVTVSSGILNYFTYADKPTKGWIILGLSNLAILIILVAGEVVYRLRLKKDIPLETFQDIDNFTRADFNNFVHNQREELVILDQFVLDVSSFMGEHPGGRFVLKHCIGRDISKFFYGGYSLDGNIGKDKPNRGHFHSAFARKIANSLIIAHFEKETNRVTTICRLREDRIYNVSPIIKTFFMQAVDKRPTDNFKKHY